MTESSLVQVPQQARSRATRLKLLDATVAALAELGYAGTSTTVVARRAGVSQGALYKHFPTKPLLLREALAHLLTDLIDDFRAGMKRRAPRDRFDRALAVLWEVFTSVPLTGAFELYLAARTDPALAEAIRPVLEAHHENLQAEALAQFPDLAANAPDFRAVVSTMMNLMQGAALAAAALPPDEAALAAQTETFRRVARQQLGIDP